MEALGPPFALVPIHGRHADGHRISNHPCLGNSLHLRRLRLSFAWV